jgi:hypothetical protein
MASCGWVRSVGGEWVVAVGSESGGRSRKCMDGLVTLKIYVITHRLAQGQLGVLKGCMVGKLVGKATCAKLGGLEGDGVIEDSRLGGRARDQLHGPRRDDDDASNHVDAVDKCGQPQRSGGLLWVWV